MEEIQPGSMNSPSTIQRLEASSSLNSPSRGNLQLLFSGSIIGKCKITSRRRCMTMTFHAHTDFSCDGHAVHPGNLAVWVVLCPVPVSVFGIKAFSAIHNGHGHHRRTIGAEVLFDNHGVVWQCIRIRDGCAVSNSLTMSPCGLCPA